MSMSGEGTLPWMKLPRIEFTSDQTRIKKGGSVSLRWDAGEATEVTFWKSTFVAPGPLDWWRISQLGEKVKAKNEIRMTQEEATVYYLVAKTPTGTRGSSILVDIVEEEKPKLPPMTWCPPNGTLQRMKDIAHVAWLVPTGRIAPAEFALLIGKVRLIEQWFSGPSPSPPTITITASPEVIFEDESSVLSNNVSNASCIDAGIGYGMDGLLPDPTDISGTAPDGGAWGASGSPSCAAPQSFTIDKKNFPSMFPQGHVTEWVTAKNAMGQVAAASQWVDILSIPQFKGSYAAHSADIRNAIKDIDKTLRNGAIYNDTALDTNVDAFKNGQMSRKGLWADLLVALQNLKLVTFNCTDLSPGAPNPYGSWTEYENEINLYWQPGANPYLEYIITHELVHKCGFNNGLMKFGYTHSQIETWACRIACACYPTCSICDCCQYTGGQCMP